MDIKEVRQKGFEFFNSNGRMPCELLININCLNELLARKDAKIHFKLTKEETYFDDLLVIVDSSIEKFEIR
jgi:hypothetical protein